jgi:pyruvate/2-oxoglutarate dehydrogenase complex dihydrolipoamide acyltransferase (E2) component
LKKYNVKLGFMSFFIKAATLALQEYPVVNSVIDGNEIVRRNYVDISVAVATPTGLMVPVLRNCQNMKFHEMEQVDMLLCRVWQILQRKVRREKSPLKTCREEHSLFQMVEHSVL